MLSALIHSTLVSTDSEKNDDNRRSYLNLMKKLKKELGDKHSIAIEQLRKLLPLPKKQAEVIICDQHGSLVDTKGHKISGFDSIDRKQVSFL